MSLTPAYSQLATLLRRRRTSKRVSRQKAAKMLHVPVETIESLENPAKSSIPDGYLPGLYRRYAKTLDLNTQQIQKLLSRLETETSKPKRGKRRRKRQTIILSSTFKRIGVVSVLALLGGYAIWQFGALFSPPRLEITNYGEYSVVSSDAITFEGRSDADSVVFLNGQPIAVDDGGAFTHTVYLQPGYNAYELSASNNFSREQRIRRIVILKPDEKNTLKVDEQG